MDPDSRSRAAIKVLRARMAAVHEPSQKTGTTRTNKRKASTLPPILSWCNRWLRQPLISEFGEPTTDRYITSCLPVIRAQSQRDRFFLDPAAFFRMHAGVAKKERQGLFGVQSHGCGTVPRTAQPTPL